MSNYEQRYQTSSRESRAGRNSVRPNSRNSVRKRPDYHAGASAGRMHKKEKVVSTTRYDFMLLFVTIGIALFGVIMIYSAGYSTAALKGNPFQYVKTQIFCLILGIVAMLLLSVFDYQIIMQKLFHSKITLVHLLYVLALFLQSIVLVIGVDLNGAKRWLRFGPVQFQPSEISKVAAIVFIAYAIYQRRRDLDTWQGIVRIFVYMSPLILLIVKENLSSAIIVVGITFGMCFVASRKKSYFIVILLLGIAALGCIFLFGQGFRMSRIHVWRDIENANETGAYQIRQGLYAIASGGIFGKGLGRSMQKLFIPEAYNDMIFSVICEELGIVGAAFVLFAFLVLFWRITVIACHAPNLFGTMLCVGVMIQLAIQVIINVAVVTNTIPSTGIPLPLISYGGTSAAVIMAEMGVVLSVSRQVKQK